MNETARFDLKLSGGQMLLLPPASEACQLESTLTKANGGQP